MVDSEWEQVQKVTGNRKRNDRNVCNVINRTYWNSNKILQNEFLLLENRVASNSFIIVQHFSIETNWIDIIYTNTYSIKVLCKETIRCKWCVVCLAESICKIKSNISPTNMTTYRSRIFHWNTLWCTKYQTYVLSLINDLNLKCYTNRCILYICSCPWGA